ncbi:MAG: chromate transporter [Lachnospiraceae bacterium]|nr:chromate transporter [Lachnospiraceae bacterium]
MIITELFLAFFRIGLFTFGGGYAMIPLIRSEVLSHGWAETEDIINFIAVSESTPGPFAINMATFIGSTTGGVVGAAAATLGVVLPSFLVILLVSGVYDRFKKSKVVKGAMQGLRPAVVGLILSALISLGIEVFKPGEYGGLIPTVIGILIFSVMIILALKKKSPILIILLSGAVGIISGYSLGL